MATLADLPNEVISLLLKKVISKKRNRRQARNYENSVWRSRKLLAVCKSWRAAALPIFYNSAYIKAVIHQTAPVGPRTRGSWLNLQPRDNKNDRTNIKMIRRNGCHGFIKKLSFDINTRDVSVSELLIILDAILLDTDDQPKLVAIRDRLRYIEAQRISYEEVRSEMEVASNDIATYVKTVFPNVNSLIFNRYTYPDDLMIFQSLITECYIGQLANLHCNMPMRPLGTLRPTRPLNISLKANSHIAIDGKELSSYRDRALPFYISPRHVKSIDFYLKPTEFIWRYFCLIGSDFGLPFDNLVSLKVRSTSYNSTVSNIMRFGNTNITFPALKVFHTNNPMDLYIVECLQQSPLEEIRYEFSNPSNLKTMLPLLKNIKRLYLLPAGYKSNAEVAELIQTLNGAFQMAEHADIVSLATYNLSVINPVNLSLAKWPYLTSLALGTEFNMRGFLKALPAMRNLKTLSISLNTYDTESDVEDAIRTLKKMHKSYSSNYTSKVTKLNIYTEEWDSVKWLAKGYCNALKLYMPNIVSVVIDCV